MISIQTYDLGVSYAMLKKRLLAWGMGVLWVFSSSITQGKELPDFTKLVETNGAAVVNISTGAKKSKAANNQQNPEKEKRRFRNIPGMPEELNELFRHFMPDDDGNGNDEGVNPANSLGSGFIISNDGYIVTNNHVVDEAGEVTVRLSDRREFVAKVIGSDKRSDIALLKVDANDLPKVKLGSSKELKVGEWVLAIGSPFGFDHSVTAGIVSAKGRSLPSDTYVPFIQTDVAINPGNSGGPLFNMSGEVVGVNSQIYSRTGGFMGLSFAIPVDMMVSVVEQLKNKGKVSRGWLGVLIQDVTRELAESLGMDKPRGALVAKVLPDSPAQGAEFKPGDVIISFGGRDIDHSSDLPPIVGMSPVGSSVVAKVIRNRKTIDVNVTIAELPSEDDLQASNSKGNSNKSTTNNRLGISVVDLGEKERNNSEINEGGVLVQKVENGAGRDAGIRKDDIILMIDNVKLKDVRHFKEVVSNLEPGQSIPILIHRRGSPLFLALKVPEK
jgi:serine protease Do